MKKRTSKNQRTGRGGRREGAGRPLGSAAKSGKTSNFSTRIDPQLRARLEAETRLSGKNNLSRTVQALLNGGLDEAEKGRREPAVKAICYLVTLLSERIAGPFAERPEYHWRTNPFFFDAFRFAVAHMLEALRPHGAVVPPSPEHAAALPTEGPFVPPPSFVSEAWESALQSDFDTPEHRGRHVAWLLMQQRDLSEAPYSKQRSDQMAQTFGREFADTITRLYYGLSDARRDLEIKPRKREQSK